MDRKKFIKKALLTGIVGTVAPQLLKATDSQSTKSTHDTLMQKVGFNH